MNAPDKIYLTTSAENKMYGNNWGCWTTRECTGVPYIRKDALLEWAKEQAAITEKLNGKGAMLKAWDTLIDKLNSL